MTGIRAGCGGARRVDRTRATTVADHPGKAFRRMRVGIRSARAGALAAMMMGAMAHAAPMFVVAGCDIPVVDEATRGRLRCGTVSVPRDPDHPQAGTIGLAVVVRRSAAPTPGAAPVLILHGGPGGEQTRYMGMSRDDLAPGRDSIAFDMRGGGRTGPALCPDLPGALLAATRAELEGRDAVAARSAALAACGSLAALFATDCRDRARHHALAAGSGPSWMALFGGIPEGACRPWPLGTPPGLPAGTAVPVLVLAAGYDAFQPDAQAVAAAIGPAATALTIPRAAHVVRGAGACPRGIVAGFIADPTKARTRLASRA